MITRSECNERLERLQDRGVNRVYKVENIRTEDSMGHAMYIMDDANAKIALCIAVHRAETRG